MEKNFTTLDITVIENKFKKKDKELQSFDINTIFLILIVLTLAVLAILLFILIQKKMSDLALLGIFA